MNEYKGFKVGDKVEVIQQGLRIHYKIGEIGVVAELLTNGLLAVVFGERREVVRPDNIKKLPKYAVGDVVRRNNKQLIKCEITSVDQLCDKTYIYTLSDCGSARFSESMLITFDGFRIGDTVWTVKRGKGTIVTGCTNSLKRPHCVNYDDGKYPKCVYPKTTNLIPTESLYKEALNKTGYAFKIDVAYVQEYVAKPYFGQVQVVGDGTKQCNIPFCEGVKTKPTFTRTAEGHLELVDGMDGCEKKYRCSKFAVHELVSYAGCIRAVVDRIHYKDGKFTYDLRTNSCPEGLPEDSLSAVAPSPKFKVGDAVYFEGKKWEIRGMSNDNVNQLLKSGMDYCLRPESDLRLWVYTKITHDDEMDVVRNDLWLKDLKSPKFIGIHINGKAIFSEDAGNGKMVIWYGIKGDDI